MIVNFTLDKISVNKSGPLKGNIEAKNSIKFLDVVESPVPEGVTNQFIIKFKFEYKIKYQPNIATTEIMGDIHFLTNKTLKDKILKEWTKDSKIEQKLSGNLVNYLFSKCGVMALSLSQQVGLPPHIPLPRITIKNPEETNEKPKAS